MIELSTIVSVAALAKTASDIAKNGRDLYTDIAPHSADIDKSSREVLLLKKKFQNIFFLGGDVRSIFDQRFESLRSKKVSSSNDEFVSMAIDALTITRLAMSNEFEEIKIICKNYSGWISLHYGEEIIIFSSEVREFYGDLRQSLVSVKDKKRKLSGREISRIVNSITDINKAIDLNWRTLDKKKSLPIKKNRRKPKLR